jgi:hypothetical protein
MLAAGLMMAHQVAGKAARDSIYLSTFPVSDLPKVVMAAAAAALLLTFISARAMSVYGPRRVVPAGFILSAVGHVAEYALLGQAPSMTAVLVYLHIAGFGAVLLSGFWSIANETYDPASAKLFFGRIAGGGTVGGILGGVAAERTAVLMPGAEILLVLAGFHLLCGATLIGSAWIAGNATQRVAGGTLDETMTPGEVLRRAPFLRDLALLVLLGTFAAAFTDYLFKAGAASAFGKGAPLLRFFAVFYTSIQVVTLAIQTLLTRPSLERLGLSRTVGSLPAANSLLAGAGLLFPAFPVFAAARGTEYALRGSLFRSGYELLYTPVAPAEKRAAKTLIDVAADRAGDATGAGVIQLLLLAPAAFLTTELLGLTLGASLTALWIARRLDQKYTGALEQRLIERAIDVDLADVHDSTTMSAVLRTRTLARAARPAQAEPAQAKPAAETDDPAMKSLAALRSGHVETVVASLRREGRFDEIEYPQLVRLLAWDPVAEDARKALEGVGERVVGLLSDRLLDTCESFAIRRRAPRILARGNSQRAFSALLEGLGDSRFEVRYQCARALDYMHSKNPELVAPRELIHRIVAGELRQGQAAMDPRKLIDKPDEEPALAYLDNEVGGGADKNTELIVSLLATILPREPLQVAFRAFHSNDRQLRGLAVEYFDSVLEGDALEAFRSYVRAEKSRSRREPQSILRDLLVSGERGRATESGGDVPS